MLVLVGVNAEILVNLQSSLVPLSAYASLGNETKLLRVSDSTSDSKHLQIAC